MQLASLRAIALAFLSARGDSDSTQVSNIFLFPSDGFVPWLENELHNFRGWINRSGAGLYDKIIKREFHDLVIPSGWGSSSKVNCVYAIADETGETLYIGKSEYPVTYRLLDHLLPKRSEKYPNGQPMNNTPEIWDSIISQGKRVQCFWTHGISFDPGALELYLLYQYHKTSGELPSLNRHRKVNTNEVFTFLRIMGC